MYIVCFLDVSERGGTLYLKLFVHFVDTTISIPKLKSLST
jgi:hypothetical protein